MFVVRPSQTAWTAPITVAPDNTLNSALYEVEDWVFNYAGLDGGWLIADGSPLDAFRVALQYGLSDGVIFGSYTAATEGVDKPDHKGYLWQPYSPVEWP